MNVLIKFWCDCEAYVQELVKLDFDGEPLDALQNQIILFDEPIMCQECYKVHRADVTLSARDIFVSINDIDDLSYEIISDEEAKKY